MLFDLPHFDHVEAASAAEAVLHLESYAGKAAIIAGGTDLLALMKDGIPSPRAGVPEALINIKNIPELRQITYDGDRGLLIGAAVTLAQLGTSEIVEELFPILSRAAQAVGSTQIRNMGTVGGNVCQRPRCMYFRHPHFLCFKKGGTRCFARAGEHESYHSVFGNGKCTSAHPSDLAPCLMALKAEAAAVGPEGAREIPLEEFFQPSDSTVETVLGPYELVTWFRVPAGGKPSRQVFRKARVRKSVDFALCSVAACAVMESGICKEISIVLGGVAPSPRIDRVIETVMRGRCPDGELISEASEKAVEGARPLPMNGYKVDLVKALVRDALSSVLGTESSL